MSKLPDLISVQVKTAIKYRTGSMKGDYRSNAPGAIKPATPSQTALSVMAEMCRIATMQGHGEEAIKMIQKVVADTNLLANPV